MLLCLTPILLTFKSTFVDLGVYRVKTEFTLLRNSFLKISFLHGFRVDYSDESHFSDVQKPSRLPLAIVGWLLTLVVSCLWTITSRFLATAWTDIFKNPHQGYVLCLFVHLFTFDFRERGRKTEKEKHRPVASCVLPDKGLNVPPAYVPWPGIELKTF